MCFGRSVFQTSALDASGVDSAFQRILTEIYRLMSRKTIAANNTAGPNLSHVRVPLYFDIDS